MLELLKAVRQKAFPVDRVLPVTEAQYVILDTELTGLDEKKDSIVSIGAVRMHGGRIDLGETFYRLASPRTALKSESVVIHGITPAEVEFKPEISSVLPEFLDFCGQDALVGHFVSIDLGFINLEAKRLQGSALSNPVLDTFTMYEWLRKRHEFRDRFLSSRHAYKLYDIAKIFGISVNGGHNAEVDAFITAQLFQRFIPMLAEAGVRESGELLRIGSPFSGGDRFQSSGEISNF